MEKLKVLRRKDLERKLGLCRSTIYALLKKGIFPAPIKLGERSVGWFESEIEDWIGQRKAMRDERRDA